MKMFNAMFRAVKDAGAVDMKMRDAIFRAMRDAKTIDRRKVDYGFAPIHSHVISNTVKTIKEIETERILHEIDNLWQQIETLVFQKELYEKQHERKDTETD